jgi:hypothetical protein
MATLEAKYQTLRSLSVDVAFAALGGGVMATRIVGASPRPAFYLLLPLSVWVVYTLDHLLDADRMGPSAQTPRHRFHYQYSRPLWIMTVLGAGICGVLGLVELSGLGVMFGIIIAALFSMHELITKLARGRASPLLIKELGVAVVFTAGTWGLPWMVHHRLTGRWFGWPILVMLQYFLLALVNLIEFSIYEARSDAIDRQTSLVQYSGRSAAGRVTVALLILQSLLIVPALILWHSHPVAFAEIVLQLMAVGLWIVLLFPRLAVRRERYRSLGDGVFLLPLLMIAMSA